MCCVKLIYLDRESEFGVDPLSFPVAEDRPWYGPLAAATSCSGEAHPAPAAALWKGRVLHFQWCAPPAAHPALPRLPLSFHSGVLGDPPWHATRPRGSPTMARRGVARPLAARLPSADG